MKCPHNCHVALVDGHRFRILRNEGQPFEPKLKEMSQPSLDPTNFSAGVRNQEEPGTRKTETDLEELAHAAAAAEWLNKQAIANEIDDLVIIADPKSLGEMRRHYHKELKTRLVGEIDKAIANDALQSVEQAIARA